MAGYRAGMSRRGVLFIEWTAADRAGIERALTALRQVHPELPTHVAAVPDGAPWRDMARVLAGSPFETTLALAADAMVLGRLDFAFEMTERYGLACCIADNPWQRQHVGASGDGFEYDIGVLFCGAQGRPVLDAWSQLAPLAALPVGAVIDGRVAQMPSDGRLGLARAVTLSGVAPFVLPFNWNLHPRSQHAFFGPVKIWRGPDAVPDAVRALNQGYEEPGAIVQFHELQG